MFLAGSLVRRSSLGLVPRDDDEDEEELVRTYMRSPLAFKLFFVFALARARPQHDMLLIAHVVRILWTIRMPADGRPGLKRSEHS
jgi:hypothetical protein